jgi:hypothetical protein
MNLSWISSESASCCYATDAKLQGRPLSNPALDDALESPAQDLAAALAEDGVPSRQFFYHLIPMAATNPGLFELAEVALTKTIGREKAESLAFKYRGLLTDLRRAFETQSSDASPERAAQARELQQAWPSSGRLYLARIETACEPGLIGSHATVVLVDAGAVGGGDAYLPYNTVCFELSANPSVELPEAVRLAWLLSTLNLDLPKYSEPLRRAGDRTIGPLAMVPAVLSAWKEGDPAACEADSLGRAIRTWFPQFTDERQLAVNLRDWWHVYRDSQITWPHALKALDQLLGDSPLPLAWDA